MGTEAFSVRTDAEKVRKLDELARQMDRSRNYIVNQAIDQLLELHAWQDERVNEGIRAAERGSFASDEQMRKILGKYSED